MKLTNEEFKELADDYANHLPENFSLFPPWMWLFLLEVMLMMFGAGMLALGCVVSFFPFASESILISAVLGMALICIPNFLLTAGKNVLGIRILRLLCAGYIALSLFQFFLNPEINWFLVLSPIVASLIVLRITYMVRFQAFALYRYRMRAWERERMRKNAVFWQKIKEKRRQEKSNPRKSSRK